MALENKLGITNSAELAREEERISKKKAVELFESGSLDKLAPGRFASLQAIHKALFEDIYDFAGELRTVNLAKGNFRFAPLMYLEAALGNIDKMPQSTFDEIIEKYVEMNISQNIIRNNIVYSSYICIRNALICVLVLFVLVSIPFTTAKSKDNNMMDSSESSISYSETIIIPDSIGVTDVSNCIIQDREARNSIEDGMIYSFVNTNKNYYVQYKCFGSEIIVEKLFCFDKVING